MKTNRYCVWVLLARLTRLDSGQIAEAPSDVVLACEARACVARLAETTASRCQPQQRLATCLSETT